MPLEQTGAKPAYQRLLDKAFANRRKQNSRVSLRAFAKDLEISHSYLLDLKSGRRKLTLKRALKMLPRLKLNAREQHLFIESVREGSLLESTTTSDKLQDVADVSVFSQWYYIGIMTLAGIPKRPATCLSIVNELGITLEQAKEAIQRLCGAGYLVRREDGSLVRSANAWDILRMRESGDTAVADHYSKQVLALADRSLKKDPPNERAISSSIFSVSESQFAFLEERLYTLCLDMMTESGKATPASTHNRVYLLSAQLVPLAKLK